LVVERAVWPLDVVGLPPAFKHDLGFVQSIEALTAERLISKLADE